MSKCVTVGGKKIIVTNGLAMCSADIKNYILK